MSSNPSPYWLVTPDDLVQHYPADFASSGTSVLEDLCAEVSAEIEGQLGRGIVQRTYTLEKYDGTGTQYLWLRNPPIVSISAVQLRDSATGLVVSDFKIVNARTGLIFYSPGFDIRPGWDRSISDVASRNTFMSDLAGGTGADQIWAFTYLGGVETVPADLRRVAREMALLAARDGAMVGIASRSIGDFSIGRWANGDQGVMERWERTLDRYRIHRLR